MTKRRAAHLGRDEERDPDGDVMRESIWPE